MQENLLERFLNLLDVPRREPTEQALFEIVGAYLARIPFENISKLYYRKHHNLYTIPGLELYLDGIERFNFGGTCYSNNYYLYQLLTGLGYQATLCGADMSNPDVHLVSLVKVDGREYLVDAGYAAPFAPPLPRDLSTDYVIELGRDRYVLKPQDEQGCSRLDLYRNGELKHGYRAKPTPKTIDDFDIAASFRDEALFMNTLLIARFFSGRSLIIHNQSIIESQGAETTIRTLTSMDEVAQVVNEHFGIPLEITASVISDLRRFEDAWS